MRNLSIQQSALLTAATQEVKPRILELMRDLSDIYEETGHGEPWQPLMTIFALSADKNCHGYWTLNANQRHEVVETAIRQLCSDGLLLESLDWTRAPVHAEYRYNANAECDA